MGKKGKNKSQTITVTENAPKVDAAETSEKVKEEVVPIIVAPVVESVKKVVEIVKPAVVEEEIINDDNNADDGSSKSKKKRNKNKRSKIHFFGINLNSFERKKIKQNYFYCNLKKIRYGNRY